MKSDEETQKTVSKMAEVVIPQWVIDGLAKVSVGDLVRRREGVVSSEMLVTDVDEEWIYCGPLKFSKETSAQVDDTKSWNKQSTGALLEPCNRHRGVNMGRKQNP